MNTADLFNALRYKLDRDNYTDYQITDALNHVMKEINLALNSISSSLITSSAVLPLVDGSAELPIDLETIITVDGKIGVPFNVPVDGNTYTIIGNKIITQGDTVTVYYRKSYPNYIFNDSISPNTIDLPTSFDNMIKNNIIAYVTGQPADIQLQAIKLIANRDGKKRSQKLIFNL